MAEPFEDHCPFVPGRIPEQDKDCFEDFRSLRRLTSKEQLLAAIAFLEIPRSEFSSAALLFWTLSFRSLPIPCLLSSRIGNPGIPA